MEEEAAAADGRGGGDGASGEVGQSGLYGGRRKGEGERREGTPSKRLPPLQPHVRSAHVLPAATEDR